MSKAQRQVIEAQRFTLNRSTELLRQSMRQLTMQAARADELEQQMKPLREERDGFAKQAKELREQLDRVATVRNADDSEGKKQAEYWKTKCLAAAAERDEFKKQWQHAAGATIAHKRAAKKRGRK